MFCKFVYFGVGLNDSVRMFSAKSPINYKHSPNATRECEGLISPSLYRGTTELILWSLKGWTCRVCTVGFRIYYQDYITCDRTLV